MKRICGSILGLCLAIAGPRSVAGELLSMVPPQEIGLSAERLQRLDALVQGYVDRGELAGAVALVARHGKVAHFNAYGAADREEGVAMPPDAIFRIMSMTKPITTVAALMLHEEGRFELYEPVAKFIPEFAGVRVFDEMAGQEMELVEPEREMTIHDLLVHTSGLIYGDGDTPIDALYKEAGVVGHSSASGEFCILLGDRSLKGMVQRLSQIPLAFHPGEQWYHGISTDVLGYLVEEVAGMPLDRFFAERIFAPLGMADTGFYVPEDKLSRLTAVYAPDASGGIQTLDSPRFSSFSFPKDFYSGGAGLVSTAPDYFRFAQMLLNGGELDGTRLLGRKTVELMTVNHLWGEYAEGLGYGLGVSVVENLGRTQSLGSEGSFGWGGAANTWFMVDPREELVAVFMTQLVPYGHYPIVNQFKTMTYQAIVD